MHKRAICSQNILPVENVRLQIACHTFQWFHSFQCGTVTVSIFWQFKLKKVIVLFYC